MTTDKREQTLGWILAGVMAVHVIVLRPQAAVELTAFAVLLAGAVMRLRQVYLPGWLGNILLLVSTAAVFLAQVGGVRWSLLGELAATVGTMMLLRPMTPTRSLRFLFCLLVIVVSVILNPFAGVGQVFLVMDAAAFYVLAEVAFRPPEVTISLWVSLARSLRVIVPVGLVVLAIFWFFPSLSLFSLTAIPSFTGSDTLNPGNIAAMVQSRRVAMTAHFAEDQAMPPASAYYWRGQVLERNEGLRWSVVTGRVNRERVLENAPPTQKASTFTYSQSIPSDRGGLLPVLDHALYVAEAKRNGQDIVVQDRGADVLTAVGGVGSLDLKIVATFQRLTDAPKAEIADGYLNVPKAVRESEDIQKIVAQTFEGMTDAPAKMRALGSYFARGGFRYSLRPGRIQDLDKFLLSQKVGFCEHYAAAAANLLRLSGVPTRIVTGYRGGEWNPYLNMITIRDSDAHAWVEAWDANSKRWLRFDPTDSVYPEYTTQIQREFDTAKWPWYRRGWSYSTALATNTSDTLGHTWDRLTSFEVWENTPVILFIILVGVALVWLVRNLRARTATKSTEAITKLLADLEARAGRLGRERKAGETPLAWLARLEHDAAEPSEKETLQHLAVAYEAGMYKPAGPEAGMAGEMRALVSTLKQAWKRVAR